MGNEQGESRAGTSSPATATSIKMAKLFAESYIEAFDKLGGPAAGFTVSPTFYVINSAQTRHRVSSLLDFTGGINGFAIINYPAESALEAVGAFLQGMGMGSDDCPKNISEEAVNTVGEICNQVLGGFRRNLEARYNLLATSGTPISMLVNTQLSMSPVDADTNFHFIRTQITTPKKQPIYVEFCIEEGVFIKLK